MFSGSPTITSKRLGVKIIWIGWQTTVVIHNEVNPSVLYKHTSTNQSVYVIGHVGDIVITGDDQSGIQNLKQYLLKHYQYKDLGQLKYFLGIEVAQSKSDIACSQRKYVLDILDETEMLDYKHIDTHMDPSTKLMPDRGVSLSNPCVDIEG